MKRKRIYLLCGLASSTLALAALAPPLVNGASATAAMRGTVFEWTDGASPSTNHDWWDEDNWDWGDGYPSSTAHGAVFPDHSGAWYVDLSSETIGQMTIVESVDFYGGESQPGPVLNVNSLVIDPADGEVTVTFNEDLGFYVNEPEP